MRISDWSSDVCSSDLSFCSYVLQSRQDHHLMPFTANGDDAAGCEARFVDNPDLGLIATGDVELARAANDGEVVGRGSEGRGAHVPRPRIDGHALVLALAADEQRRTVVGDVETVQLPADREGPSDVALFAVKRGDGAHLDCGYVTGPPVRRHGDVLWAVPGDQVESEEPPTRLDIPDPSDPA